MKTIVSTFLLVMGLSGLAMAQESETLFDNANIVGAFGGPFLEYTEILGEQGVMVGGGGALQFKHFFLGGYGIGTHFPQAEVDAERYAVNLGHGGFWLGYTIPSHKLVHFYGSARIGWGNIRFKEDADDSDRNAFFSDRIFAFTPEIGIELNISDFFRIAATGGYRMVSDVDNLPEGFGNEDFSNFMGGLTFRFGAF